MSKVDIESLLSKSNLEKYLPFFTFDTNKFLLEVISNGLVGGSLKETADFCGQPFGVSDDGRSLEEGGTLFKELVGARRLSSSNTAKEYEVRREMLDYPKTHEQRKVLRDLLAGILGGEEGCDISEEPEEERVRIAIEWVNDLINLKTKR